MVKAIIFYLYCYIHSYDVFHTFDEILIYFTENSQRLYFLNPISKYVIFMNTEEFSHQYKYSNSNVKWFYGTKYQYVFMLCQYIYYYNMMYTRRVRKSLPPYKYIINLLITKQLRYYNIRNNISETLFAMYDIQVTIINTFSFFITTLQLQTIFLRKHFREIHPLQNLQVNKST